MSFSDNLHLLNLIIIDNSVAVEIWNVLKMTGALSRLRHTTTRQPSHSLKSKLINSSVNGVPRSYLLTSSSHLPNHILTCLILGEARLHLLQAPSTINGLNMFGFHSQSIIKVTSIVSVSYLCLQLLETSLAIASKLTWLLSRLLKHLILYDSARRVPDQQVRHQECSSTVVASLTTESNSSVTTTGEGETDMNKLLVLDSSNSLYNNEIQYMQKNVTES